MKHTSIGIIAAVLILLFAGPASAWYGDYGYRIPLNIDNTAGSALTDYQLNVSLGGIDADSIRVVDEIAGTTIPHWCETVTGDDCYEVWFNVTNLPAGVWTNSTYYIYYQYSGAACASDFDTTFTKKYNDTGLVLELRMDDGTGTHVTDTSGEGNHGTMVGMTSPYGWQGVDGGQWGDRSDITFATGDHLRLDGSDDYVDCGHDTSMDFGTDNFSVSFWFKSTSESWGRFVGKEGDPNHSWWCADGGANNRLRWRLQGSSSVSLAVTQNEVVFDDEWHHAVWVVDRTHHVVTWYFDGVKSVPETDISSFTGLNFDSASPVLVGKSVVANYLTGSVDELRIYNRSLSEEGIGRQYVRSKYTTHHPSTSLGAIETYVIVEHLEGWQGLGQDATESYSDLVMIIGVCVLILVVGGIIIGLRSFAGEVSPGVVIMIAVAIAFGLLVLVMMVEVVPSVMAPMENIIMEGL